MSGAPGDLAPPPEAYRPRGLYATALKPSCDFVGAALLLLALAPLMAAVAVAVRLDSPGPALFTQDRVGRGGRLFRICKFRTMRSDAGGPVLTQVGDPRITRIGRFLRRTSLDELPQLFNILRGEMSFIGPRPEVPSIVASEYTPEMKGALTVRPGLSGWAQVHGRDDLSIPTKLAYDVEYVRKLSPWLDLRICLLTPGLLLSGRGIK
ncbi:MAG: sugar transferase [Candidatus Sericytochromatia bacterium]|nr:sugar transferase [Candidatus Tanganyikabacteria bacterium]